eukprot:746766-Hanusia_phi.AAC.2
MGQHAGDSLYRYRCVSLVAFSCHCSYVAMLYHLCERSSSPRKFDVDYLAHRLFSDDAIQTTMIDPHLPMHEKLYHSPMIVMFNPDISLIGHCLQSDRFIARVPVLRLRLNQDDFLNFLPTG